MRHQPRFLKGRPMKQFVPVLVGAVCVCVWASSVRAAGPELKTDDQKVMYALGVLLSQNLAPFALNQSELELVEAGLADGVLNHEKRVDVDAIRPKIQELARTRNAAA